MRTLNISLFCFLDFDHDEIIFKEAGQKFMEKRTNSTLTNSTGLNQNQALSIRAVMQLIGPRKLFTKNLTFWQKVESKKNIIEIVSCYNQTSMHFVSFYFLSVCLFVFLSFCQLIQDFAKPKKNLGYNYELLFRSARTS